MITSGDKVFLFSVVLFSLIGIGGVVLAMSLAIPEGVPPSKVDCKQIKILVEEVQ